MDMPYSDTSEFCAIIVEVAKASGREAAYIRPLVFFGGDTVRLAPAQRVRDARARRGAAVQRLDQR